MKKVLIATKNEGKVREFQTMFALYDIQAVSLLDVDGSPDVEETGSTFAENARIKAEAITAAYGVPVIADDSGLVVDALDGRPGVFSARYAGIEKDDQKNIDKVLSELKGVPEQERTARFVCALAVSRPGAETKIVEGTCEGWIGNERKGTNGFGYDPIFMMNQTTSMAEMKKEEKNKISHRANALKKLENQLHLLF